MPSQAMIVIFHLVQYLQYQHICKDPLTKQWKLELFYYLFIYPKVEVWVTAEEKKLLFCNAWHTLVVHKTSRHNIRVYEVFGKGPKDEVL